MKEINIEKHFPWSNKSKVKLTYLIGMILVVVATACHSGTENKALSGIKNIPEFRIISLDSSTCISSARIPTGTPILLFYFDPECEHCQRATKGILDHENQLKNTKIYLVSNSSTSEIKKFYQKYHLDMVQNMIVGNDYEFSFYRVFLPPTTPYTVLYNSQKKLIKLFTGDVDINSVINLIEIESKNYFINHGL